MAYLIPDYGMRFFLCVKIEYDNYHFNIGKGILILISAKCLCHEKFDASEIQCSRP